MKQIELTQGKVAIVNDEDFESLSKRSWYAVKGKTTFYAVSSVTVNKRQVRIWMHREILKPLKSQIVDHKNHNGCDNRRENLRTCSINQNCRNQRIWKKAKSSKYKGVHFHKRDNVWTAYIHLNGKHIHIGSYQNEIEAAIAYNQKAVSLFGEFAYLNEIPDTRHKTQDIRSKLKPCVAV